ncbi:MAG: NADH-quinone oxidoreductase subunit NuoG, partial [Gammaproteobacteria bacterium]|nr:NADH-quinone oxidoreductase subunit NuoG [Gammaproteobacteria bacterium]
MSDNTITIHIDGRPVSARPGQMLIEVMDANDVAVPRFCYHPRLTVAANCRMCMVEVERAPKPLPACATPVAKDMIVRSRSKLALEGQKGTMEMLLINHPLDCPVCDQGGECELQDVSLAHGQSYSRYQEGKRAVEDEDIGSLISTDMTRCIHCTRCVRFGVEVAGQAELGATGRGEDMRIGTFVKHAVSSELSGNMIDVCPVGALNSKPYRMRARAWEMDRHESIAAHDCLGSHTYVHTLRGQVMRELPRECESINQSWLSDRDRFSYTALDNPQRRTRPQIFDTVRDRYKDTDWYSAITTAAKALLNAVQFSETARVGVLVGAGSTLEEMHLLARLCARLGIENIDHRLTQTDFSFQDDMPAAPWLGCTLEQLAASEAIVLIGADVRKQQPLLGARLRQAALAGAHISTLNLFREDLNFETDEQLMGDSEKIFSDLLSVFRHLTKSVKSQSASQKEVSRWTSKFIVKPSEEHKRLAARLKNADSAAIILGAGAFAWPNFSAVRALAQALSELTNARFGFLTPGANTVGAWFAGCVPHRNAVGSAKNTASLAGSVAISAGSTATLFDSDTSASDSPEATTHSPASTPDATGATTHSPANASGATGATAHSSASTSTATETSAHSPASTSTATETSAHSP